jgi:hypothetical protein
MDKFVHIEILIENGMKMCNYKPIIYDLQWDHHFLLQHHFQNCGIPL